jgi:poly(hydroxyalkanoate) granule-associated protein
LEIFLVREANDLAALHMEVHRTMVVEKIPGAEEAQTKVKETAGSMTAAVRKVLLAGVGAVALTKDEIEDFVAKLVERGEIAEQDGRRLVKDVLARRREQAEKVEATVEVQVEKAESTLDQRIEGMLTRLNVPTKSDIDELSSKISILAEKVDALQKSTNS